MSRTLPSRPDIVHLRHQAKELHQAAAVGDQEAVGRVEAVGRPLSLSSAQLALAREYGYESWPRLRAAVAELAAPDGPQVTGPLFRSKHQTDSVVYTPGVFLAAARAAGWDPGPLPDAIVFTFSGLYAHLLGEDARFEPNALLAPGNSSMFTSINDSPRVGVTCLSPGATAMVAQVENQVELGGAQRFLILGTAGAIHRDIHPGDVVAVTAAVRDDGISHHYLPPDTHVDADETLTSDLLASLERRGINAKPATTWTVPTPYRSTRPEIEQLAADGSV